MLPTTTVQTPAVDPTLIDLATLKDDLAVTVNTSDGYLTRAIVRASARVQRYCNRAFGLQAYQDTWAPCGNGWGSTLTPLRGPLQLSAFPVYRPSVLDGGPMPPLIAVTEVGAALTLGTDFTLDAALGQLTRTSLAGVPQWWGPVVIVATYQAGYGDVPDDVADACSRLVKIAWRMRGRDPTVKSETTPGVYSVNYGGGGEIVDKASGLPADVVALLDPYRVPVTA